MTNPFEVEHSFLVLRNSENNHSIWPAHIAVPAGWKAVFGPDVRQECLAYIGQHWIDLRPLSLIRRQNADTVL
nr:MbtH family protein [Notoacmeibacter marinus]